MFRNKTVEIHVYQEQTRRGIISNFYLCKISSLSAQLQSLCTLRTHLIVLPAVDKASTVPISIPLEEHYSYLILFFHETKRSGVLIKYQVFFLGKRELVFVLLIHLFVLRVYVFFFFSSCVEGWLQFVFVAYPGPVY